VNFGDGSFHGKLAFKISKSDPTEELLERIGEDMKFLNMFDNTHSLDTFLFKTKAEQLEMDSQIHPAYFAISDAEWEKIKLPIREKISKLVSKALDGMGEDTDNLARQQYVEHFLTKSGKPGMSRGSNPSSMQCRSSPRTHPKCSSPGKRSATTRSATTTC